MIRHSTAGRDSGSTWLAWPARHPGLAVAFALVAAAGSVLIITQLKASGSLTTMYPRRQDSARAMADLAESFPVAEGMMVIAALPNDAPPDPARLAVFASRLEQHIAADPWLREHTAGLGYRQPDQAEAFLQEQALPALWLYLDQAQAEALHDRLSEQAMARALRRAERAAAAPGAAGAMTQALLADPLRLRELVADRFSQGLAEARTPGGDGLFLSRDRRRLLINIKGTKPVSDMTFVKRFVKAVTSHAEQANTDGLMLAFAGAYAIADIAQSSIRADMIRSIVGTIILLQILFLLTYRHVLVFPLAILPVAAGILIGFAAFTLMGWPLSPPTAVIGAMLAGLGLDYVIHYLSHYHSLPQRGPAAAEKVARVIGPTLVVACCTSVIAFAAVGSSDVPALRHFSVIGIVGLIAILAMTFCLLPATLAFISNAAKHRQTMQLRWHLEPVVRAAVRWRGAGIGLGIATALLCVATVIATPGRAIRFGNEFNGMHPQPNPPLQEHQRIASDFPGHGDALMLLIRAPNENELLALSHRVKDRLVAPHDVMGSLSVIVGLHNLLPDPAAQARRRQSAQAVDAEAVVAAFKDAVDASAFDSERLAGYADYLGRLLRPPEAPSIADLRAYPQLAGSFLPHGRVESEHASALTLLFLDETVSPTQDRGAMVRAIREALADEPGVTLTGMSVIGYDLESTIASGLSRLGVLAAAAVAVLLIVSFRSLRDAGLALVPLFIGVCVLLAWMKLTGMRLNLINLVAVPLLIGLGVDDGVFLVGIARSCRRRGFSRDELLGEMAASCHAVTMTSLTTMLAFGSLALTTVPAIRSMGLMLAVGIAACLLSTVLVLAPVLYMLHRAPVGAKAGPP